MTETQEALFEELRAAGHLREVAPLTGNAFDALAFERECLARSVDEGHVSRWVLSMQICGAWLSALFLLLFLGLGAAPLIKGAGGWIAVGLLLSGGAAGLLRVCMGSIRRQFLLVASLAGHGALLLGASLFDSGHGSSFVLVALYEALLLGVVAWRPHRMVAALLCCGALLAGVYLLASPEAMQRSFVLVWLAATLLWANEGRWQGVRQAEAIEALGWALTLFALWFALFGLPWYGFVSAAYGGRFSREALSVVSLVMLFWQGRHLMRVPRTASALLLLLSALAAGWQAPAMVMGALLLVLGFARGARGLAWVGGAAFVFGLSRYYYDLEVTLLIKSVLLIAGGALLLGARALLREPLVAGGKP